MGVSVCVGVNVLTCRRIISGYIFRFTIGFFWSFGSLFRGSRKEAMNAFCRHFVSHLFSRQTPVVVYTQGYIYRI